jgi:murein DD-endopeptidase MepM/ murein hydrolase activator NlpD
MSQLRGFAEGGTVPSRGLRGTYGDTGTGDLLAKLIGPTIDQRVNEAIQSIEKELMLKSGKKDGGGPGPGAGPGGGAGGYAEGEKNFVSSKEVYDYLRSKGVSHIHAMGMLANIQAESSFNAGAIGDGGTSGGLFQHHAERFSGMVAFAGKDWPKNWKRQVDYALREGAGQQYANKQFKNAEEASAWFTLNFERPSNKEQKARERLDNLKNFGSDGSWKGSAAQSPEAMVTGGIKPSTIKLTSGQGMRKHPITGEWKEHKGIDLAGPDGSPISSAQDAKVIWAGDKGDGYGNTVILRYSNGAETRFAHLKSLNVRSGQTIKASQLIGKQGSTGTSTASHLHFEYYPNGGAMSYTGNGDAFSVKDSYFRYGGNVQPKVAQKPLTPTGQPPKPSSNAINATGMSGSQLISIIKNIKPGQKVVFPGVGSVQGGKDWMGRPQTKYFDPKGKSLTEAEFTERVRKKNQSQPSQPNQANKPPGPVPAPNLPGRFSGGTIEGLQQYGALQKQGGGFIAPSKSNRPNVASHTSYNHPESNGTLLIQPIIYYVDKPSTGGNKMIAFPVPIAVNSSMPDLSSSRG